MDTFERSEFAKRLNTVFRLTQVDPPLDLKLVEVSELFTPPGQESFSLTFSGPRKQLLPQGTNLFRHEQMGEFQIFTTPIREDANAYYYEAIFNRVVPMD